MGSQLPEMSAPPVSEVVCGVRFAPLPLDPIDFGALWQERRDEYPENEQLFGLWSTAHRHVRLDFAGKVRILGSTVIKLLNMAQGRFVGAVMPQVHAWDVAAGLPVLWEAGFEATDDGGAVYDHLSLDPAEGYVVPRLILASPENRERVRRMVTFLY